MSTASAAASGPASRSRTWSPARLQHLIRFCPALTAPVTMWTRASRRTPAMPTGSRMPSWSSTMNSCGRTWRTSWSVGRATARAASTTRSTSPGATSRLRTATTPWLLKPLMGLPAGPEGEHAGQTGELRPEAAPPELDRHRRPHGEERQAPHAVHVHLGDSEAPALPDQRQGPMQGARAEPFANLQVGAGEAGEIGEVARVVRPHRGEEMAVRGNVVLALAVLEGDDRERPLLAHLDHDPVRQLAVHARRADPAVRGEASLRGGRVDVPDAHAGLDTGRGADLVSEQAMVVPHHHLPHGEVRMPCGRVAQVRPGDEREPDRERARQRDGGREIERAQARPGPAVTVPPRCEEPCYQLPTS